MALVAAVQVQVLIPDGTLIAQSTRSDLIFNPSISDMRMEAQLVMSAAERLAQEALERVGERMHDWGETAARMAEEDADGGG